jgi:hypothetical protein
MINVSEIITDPDLCQAFTVNRQSGQFGAGGWVPGAVTVIPMTGIAYPATEKEIKQVPEGDRATEAFAFYSTQELFVTHNDGVPGTSDQIVYQGDTYRLYADKNWSAAGYWKAIGVRMAGD